MPPPEDSNYRKGYVRPNKYVRPKDDRVRLLPGAKDNLESLTKKYKLTEKVVLSTLLDRAIEIDLLSKGFTEKVEAVREAGKKQLEKNRYERLDNAPGCFWSSEEYYHCFIARLNKSPEIKKLSKHLDEARAGCDKCIAGRVKLLENKKLKEQNKILLDERENGRVGMYPICKLGGEPNEDLTEMKCPEISLRSRPIKERKKKKDYQPCHAKGSAPYKRCEHIDWKQVVFKGDIAKSEK